jgi:hypothetical protein
VIYKEAKEFGFRYTRKREICQKARRRSKVWRLKGIKKSSQDAHIKREQSSWIYECLCIFVWALHMIACIALRFMIKCYLCDALLEYACLMWRELKIEV